MGTFWGLGERKYRHLGRRGEQEKRPGLLTWAPLVCVCPPEDHLLKPWSKCENWGSGPSKGWNVVGSSWVTVGELMPVSDSELVPSRMSCYKSEPGLPVSLETGHVMRPLSCDLFLLCTSLPWCSLPFCNAAGAPHQKPPWCVHPLLYFQLLKL